MATFLRKLNTSWGNHLSNKEILRTLLKAKRKAISLQRRQEAAAAAYEAVLSLNPGLILSFASFGTEIDLSKVNEHLAQEDRLILPEQLDIDLKHISYALIPGLGFDRRGFRIGYGKGFYDQLLPLLSCKKIGIGFTEQLVEEDLALEPHDAPVDQLLLF